MTSTPRRNGQTSKRPHYILVPPSIVAEVKSNSGFSTRRAFSPDALLVRSVLRDTRVDPSVKTEMVLTANRHVSQDSTISHSIMHAAAATPDILLTHEYLYAGCSPDLRDQHNRTPIGMALWHWAMLQFTADTEKPQNDLQNLSAAFKRVVRLFIEQHADVNVIEQHADVNVIEKHADVNGSRSGTSLLGLACLAKDWETISLLLEHGAKLASPNECPTDEEDRAKFSELVALKSLTEGQPRPARVCPCWSGKTLADCHGATDAHIPYPSTYMCICGKGKSYENCCAHKTSVFEYWDTKTSRIMAYTDSASNESPEFRAMIRKIQALDFGDFKQGPDGEVRDLSKRPNVPFGGLDGVTLERFRLEMIRLNKVHPAFAYAMKIERFPLRDKSPRMTRAALQFKWNAAVDKYIALQLLQLDSKLKSDKAKIVFDIEKEAKIGQWGGRLIRECEGPNCGKLEGRDIEKVQQCKRCQITVYCSPKCQKVAWPAHRKECCQPFQSPKPLPSQQKIMEYMLEGLRSDEPNFDEMVDGCNMVTKGSIIAS